MISSDPHFFTNKKRATVLDRLKKTIIFYGMGPLMSFPSQIVISS